MGEEEIYTSKEMDEAFKAFYERRINLEEVKKRIKAIDDKRVSIPFDRISTYLEEHVPNVRQRLDDFRSRLDKEFLEFRKILEIPHRVDTEVIIELAFKRSVAVGFMQIMHVPLMLYSLNLNGPAIIELHGVFERFIIDTVSALFYTSEKEVMTLRKRILERRTLYDLALILKDLDIWDKDDMKFVKKLSRLRNALAHRNVKKLSKLVYSGRPISVFEIEDVMTDVDFISRIIRTLHLMIKAGRIYLWKKDKLKLEES